MAFTKSNDYNFLQASDAAIVGAGEGSDTYVLHGGLLSAGKNITISDATGANVLQLAGGLQIKSSVVAGNALKLTLNNDAAITVLGANAFRFTTGGDVPLGTGGQQNLTYQQFVASHLGVASLPTSGTQAGATNITFSTDGSSTATLPPAPAGLLETAQTRSAVNAGLSTLATSATEYVNTLDSGTHWGKSNLTYSFNTAIPAEYTSNPDLTTGWRQLTTTEKNAVNAVIADINTLLGVQLTAVSSNGDLRFNAVSQTGNTAGFAFSPGSEEGGDVFLDRNAPAANYAIGADSYFTVVHEVGHALGLKHPFEGSPVLPTNLDNTVHSVMSYTEFRGREFVATWNTATNSVSATNAVTRTQSEFSLYDVHTLQALYGGNATHNTGNDTYTAVAGSYQTLWDAGGKDLIDLSNTAGVAKIDLRPGTLSSANIKTLDDLIADALADLAGQGAPSGVWLTDWVTTSVTQYEPELYNGTNNLTIPLGVLIEEVKTGGNHDEVRDNAVDNRISTGAGNDSIFLGQGGFDVIDAGLGSDKVFFDIPSTAVQREAQTDGSVVVVAANFAAQLIGVETLVFSDQQISL